MDASELSATAFLAASAAHAAFQVTVTVLVYPVLVLVGPEEWERRHDRHSRAILPLVVLTYGALVLASVPFAIHHHGPAAWVALAGGWAAMVVTALVAAPTHGRLTSPEPPLLRRLVVADRWRAALACVGLVRAAASVRAG